jgi:hypothetical protein
MINKVVKAIKNGKQFAAAFSYITKPNQSVPTRRQRLQFSKHRLVDFG